VTTVDDHGVGDRGARRAAQAWDPARYAREAGFVSELGRPLLGLLAPREGERILDLGCGEGTLATEIAAAGCRVVAVDAAPEMVVAARARGVDARVADGEALAFDAEFDAVFSNAALHWMRAPDRAIDGVWRALVAGGRFVGELGGQGNVASIAGELERALARRDVDGRALNPWYFPSAAEYRQRLERRGFEIVHIERFERPTRLPGDIGAWLETFAGPFLAAVPATERPALLAEVRAALAPRLADEHGCWHADYVRVRFVATKPGARR